MANIVLAQEKTGFLGQLVRCSGVDCGKADLMALVANVIQFMIDISLVIAVVMVIWGGILLMTSGGNEDRVTRGKKALTAAIIGLVIVLVAWVAINTFITLFTNCSGSWEVLGPLMCG